MPNYFVSYDLNGIFPTHEEMDAHLINISKKAKRVLETVWHINSQKSLDEITDEILGIMSDDDSLLVIEARDIRWSNLLISDSEMRQAWLGNSPKARRST